MLTLCKQKNLSKLQAFWKETRLMKFQKHHMLMCYHLRTSRRILHCTGNQNSCRHKFSLKNQMKRTYTLTKFLAFLQSTRLHQKEQKQTSRSSSVQINAGQRYTPSGEVNKRGEVPQCGSEESKKKIRN